MATKDFKVRNGLIVGTTITLGDHTVSRLLDSENVTAIVNATTQGLTDSDLKTVADLRNDLDSESGEIRSLRADADSDSQKIQTMSGQISALEAGTYDDSQLVARLDSDQTAISALRRDVDSDSIVIQSLDGRVSTLENAVDDTGFDSDQVVAIINENIFASDSDAIINVFQDPDNGLPSIYATVVGPVQFRAKNDSGSDLFPGTAVYIKGISGEVPTVDKANASSGSTMPAFGIVSAVSNDGADCFVTTFGDLKNINTSAFSIGQTVYISADSDGALTQTKPSNATDLIQNIGLVTRVHASSGSIRVGGSGRTNDIDNATRARLDSDSLAIQSLSTRINSVKDDIDSETARIQLLLLSTDSDALSLAETRRDAESDAAAIVVIKQNAESDSAAIQALQSELAPRLDSDELKLQLHSGRLDVLESRADSDETQLQVINTSINTINTRLDSDETALQTLDTKITDLQARADSDTTAISILRRELDSEIAVIRKLRAEQDSDSLNSGGAAAAAGMTDSDLKVVADLRNDLTNQNIADHADTSFSQSNSDTTGALTNTLTGDGFSTALDGDTFTYSSNNAFMWSLSGESSSTIESTLTEILEGLSHRLDSDVITFSKADSEAFYIKNDSGGYMWIHPTTTTGAYDDGAKLRIKNTGSALTLGLVEGDSNQPARYSRRTSGSWPPSFGTNFEAVTEAGIFTVSTQATTTTVTNTPNAGDFLFYDGSNWVGSGTTTTRLNEDSDKIAALELKTDADSDRLVDVLSNVDSDLTGQRLSDHQDVETVVNYYNDLSPTIPTSFYFNDVSDSSPQAFSGTTRVNVHAWDADTALATRIAAYENAVTLFYQQADALGRLDSDIITFENNEGIFLKYSTGQMQVIYPVQSDSDYDTNATFRFFTDNGQLKISSGNGATATHYIVRYDSDIASQSAGSVIQIGWADVSTYAKKEVRPSTNDYLKWNGTNWVASSISSGGLTDSDLAVVSKLRNDVDSDSAAIQTISGRVDTLETRADSDETVIQSNTGRIAVLETRADSDELALQALDTRISAVQASLDSETARIQLLLASTDSDALSLAELRRDADSDAAAIVVLKQNAESDSLAIQALSSTISPRLDSDELAIQAIRTDMDVSFTIVNNGASAYTFTGDGFPSGVDNPTLYLHRGHTYNFRVNASGHPFEIRLSNGGSAYSTGVTNNAAQVGLVKFVVPMDAPDSLVYQCTVHSGMVGTIKIGKQGFDSDQIVSMISANSGASMTDSDLAVVAKLRNDVDSDSIKLQALEETVAGISAGSGFDSDQIVAIINENPTSSGTGMTDSDLKVVADLRNDITALQTSGAVSQESTFTTFKYKATQGQTTFSGVDRNNQTLSYTAGNINVFINGVLINDSDDYTATNGSSVVLDLAADSDDVVVIQKMRSTFDSDSVASVFNNNLTDLTITRFDFTATQGQTTFSGSDDNGNSLSYAVNKIQVYLNGILMLDTTDYTAVNGTSITLVTAADSDDKLSVIKYLGKDGTVSDAINITRFTYKYTPEGAGTVGDSEITGGDENGNTLAYTVGKIQVYSNGILLEDSDDYVATSGSSIVLRAAPDSDDVVTVFKYLGTTQSGFDSEQVVAIVNENSSGVTTGKAIAMAIVFGG